MQEWAQPVDAKELGTFLGFTSFLRGYVRHYADLEASLRELLHAKTFVWTEVHTRDWLLLKEAIARSPYLNFADFDKPWAIATDASRKAIGAVLWQPQFEGDVPRQENIVSFA